MKGTAQKMTTFRAYYKNQRVATGKDYKDTRFLQVYPSVKEFETRTDWIMAWYNAISEEVTFVDEKPVVKAPAAAAPLPPAPRPSRSKKYIPASEAIFTILAREAAAAPPPPPPSPPPTTTPSAKGWAYRKELTFTAPAGTYYIGDLCYALYDTIYDNIFGGCDYRSGFYSKGSSFFMVDNTAYGDGDYKGSDDYHYLVDAGIIGICSADLIDPENPSVRGGKIHTFAEPVEVRFKGGVFYFTSGYTHLTIDTAGYEEEEENDY